jgi:hypothetical protein
MRVEDEDSKPMNELGDSEESLRLKTQCLELGIYDLIWEARNLKL